MWNLTDEEFLEHYWDHVGFVWFEFETKQISMTEREESLEPYRKRLHKMMTEGIIDDRFKLVKRT